MHFYYADVWDKGDFYQNNQDSFSVQMVLTGGGPYALAVVCDGIGSLSRGEYAGGCVATAVTTWFYEQALLLLCENKSFRTLCMSFYRALNEIHQKLQKEGEEGSNAMGTTVSALILSSEHFYLFHVGDCRCYKIGKKISCLSKEQTNETGALTGAVGVGKMPGIQYKKGRYRQKESFLLCSDGFGRCLTTQGLMALKFQKRRGVEEKRRIMQELVERGRERGERDNCTGILLKRL